MKLKDIIKTKQEINEMGYDIANNIITNVNIQTIAHFGNSTCFEIMCNDVCPMSGYHNTPNLGYILKAFIELLIYPKKTDLELMKLKIFLVDLFLNPRMDVFGDLGVLVLDIL